MSNTDVAKVLSNELKERGLIKEAGGGELEEILSVKRKVYLGIDPTADSLTVGHLVPVFLMKHLADAGHQVHFLVGGGTGMIGDPRASGERVLLDAKTITLNTKAVRTQLQKILGKQKYTMFNNIDWLGKLTLVEFLRDTAKHFTINQLIKREIIKKRLDDENDSISFTEFSYSLLQGFDFWYLHKKYNIDLQIGGSDQWANIISGVDLVRRRDGASVYAITTPLLIDKKTGKKFGKSEGNAVWLDAKKTSPFSFYQFWLNVSDGAVADYLKILTFLPLAEIEKNLSDHAKDVSKRIAQRLLARQITAIVHGFETATTAEKMSDVLYSKDPLIALGLLVKSEIEIFIKEIPNIVVSAKEISNGFSVTDALFGTGLTPSKGEAKRSIEGGAVRLNEKQVTDIGAVVTLGDFIQGRVLLRCSKRVSLLILKK
jgi:tyrosyl-tRNA synthetase